MIVNGKLSKSTLDSLISIDYIKLKNIFFRFSFQCFLIIRPFSIIFAFNIQLNFETKKSKSSEANFDVKLLNNRS